MIKNFPYFLAFTKYGLVLAEKGNPPPYIAKLILSLDPKRLKTSRNVQNQTVFVEVHFDKVFLGIYSQNNYDLFENDINDFLTGSCQNTNSSCSQIISVETKNDQILLKNTEDMSSKKLINKKPKKKKQRIWDEISDSEQPLDFSEKPTNNVISYSIGPIQPIKNKFTFNLFKKTISREDLRSKLQNQLLTKNVGTEITQNILDNVLSNCQSNVSPSDCSKLLRSAISDLIHSANHSELINQIKNSQKIFSICFVGLNGVGKSTSLAKICCWLLQHDLKVFIAACDTFRAGAIEQLKVHVDSFQKGGHDVGFYTQGYSKDDAFVAKQAIATAQKQNYDVILIDTAGRMHSNANLMQSLSKIVRLNDIDYFLYVGEALTGNDSLEHLNKFNEAIQSGNENKRIDGLFITKTDAVEDKLGQVLNMCVCADCPVLFLGNGQSNVNVAKLDPETIADSLVT